MTKKQPIQSKSESQNTSPFHDNSVEGCVIQGDTCYYQVHLQVLKPDLHFNHEKHALIPEMDSIIRELPFFSHLLLR